MKTKIICTLGPSSDSPEILEQLVAGGMDIARINFSHATEDEFYHRKNLIESFNKKHKKQVGIMADLQGPRMRVGELPDAGIELLEEEEIMFTTDPADKTCIYIKDPYLHEDIEVNHPIFLANGDLELFVTEKKGSKIRAKVLRGGILHSKKGINLPDTNLRTGGLTEKDIKDVKFAIDNGVEYIAMSFVKDGKDIANLKKLINHDSIKIIAKIERKQALLNLEDIMRESDVIMIARGDLGVEIPLEELPVAQKDIIKKGKELKTPTIVATQMLVSMVNHHRPTRAEVSDVANAVMDGAWGVMLSDETAYGKYPVQCLSYLVRTVEKAENFLSRPSA